MPLEQIKNYDPDIEQKPDFIGKRVHSNLEYIHIILLFRSFVKKVMSLYVD